MNAPKRKRNNHDGGNSSSRWHQRSKNSNNHGSSNYNHHGNNSHHRFGRVMSQPPKLKLQTTRGGTSDGSSSSSSSCHYPTVSIAIPGSVVSNAQTRELQTQLAGQIARAAAVFRVDEIVVFDDGLGSTLKTVSNYRRGPRRDQQHHESRPGDRRNNNNDGDDNDNRNDNKEGGDNKPKQPHLQPSTDPHAFLARILQYCECPQYLRRKFFPMHPDLQFAGLLPPLDMPHHLRRGDVAAFREGVVVDRKKDGDEEKADEEGSFVNCGVPNRLVQIDRVITPGIRCTVRPDIKAYESKSSKKGDGVMKGTVVSPTTPRDEDGIYWGYTTRLASGINAIFEECPYEGGYDLKVGTSERGDVSIDDPKFCLRKKETTTTKRSKKSKGRSGIEGDSNGDEHFNHLLIVFGGVAGIEESVDADESMTLSGEDSKKMFDVWVNICPYQGSRTIRSEEAVFIALSRLSPYIAKNVVASTTAESKGKSRNSVVKTEDVEFSDEAISEESSDEE
eukprot:CAMPEP_0183756638 /NCGR_PEP_ID=MMETSP0739-20130205/5172_1 /TAXON_ID=385413 /ORGANISM="Thalassiosira miniscula, Strain CCMP1093" /LENGTH=504 /DNA_ID=CAMNT_0025993883 /DNA_START=88 /DNA_END=1602 /DNA_ORIENTATION=+